MDNSIFLVNQEPYCIWEMNVQQRNKEFLDGIDIGYFDYVLDTHLNSEDEKRASIAIRSTLHHALETLFSLLGAYVQAPDCAYAWIAKCTNQNLRDFVANMGRIESAIFTKLPINSVSWDDVSKSVFTGYLPGSEKNAVTSHLYAKLWSRLAREFLNQTHIDEYNSIKHGFRIRSGGFQLAVGKEHDYGEKPPAEEMTSVGGSEHGTTFFRLKKMPDKEGNRSLISRRHSLNWRIERTVLLVQLISMSITNITSALKIVNGVEASTCIFRRPTEDKDFEKPWSFSTGITSCDIDFVISENEIVSSTRAELLKKIC